MEKGNREAFTALKDQSLMDDSLYVTLDAAKAAALIVDENDLEAVCWIRGRVKDAKRKSEKQSWPAVTEHEFDLLNMHAIICKACPRTYQRAIYSFREPSPCCIRIDQALM